MRFFHHITVVLAATVVSSCVPMEKFSNQATEYNVQTATTQDRTLVLNVIRAAYRFPMHFTELTTLSGTGTLTLGGTVTGPVGVLNGGMGTGSIAPTGSFAETPTFNVAVLETQEFYQGMMKPLTVQQTATYLDEGLQPELIFTLFFGSIEYQPLPNAATSVIENNFHPTKCENLKSPDTCAPNGPLGAIRSLVSNHAPCPASSETEYLCFKEVLRALLERHLTTEATDEVKNVGPLLNQAAFNDPRWLSGLDPKTYKVVSVDLKACVLKADSCPEGLKGLPVEQQSALKRGESLFRIQKESKDYRFCFDEEAPPPQPENVVGSGRPKEVIKPQPVLVDAPERIRTTPLPREVICKSRVPKTPEKPPAAANDLTAERSDVTADSSIAILTALQAQAASSGPYRLMVATHEHPEQAFSVQFQPRSTEGIIYYLGEISRCMLKLDPMCKDATMPMLQVKYHGTREDELFHVCKLKHAAGETEATVCEPRATPDPQTIQAHWQGTRYAVTMDPSGQDRSGQVLRLLTQLLALNRAAKDYPAPAVVPVISH